MTTNHDGEFRGATTAQIQYIKEQLFEIRGDMKALTAALVDLQAFKSKILAYVTVLAAGATGLVQFVIEKVG